MTQAEQGTSVYRFGKIEERIEVARPSRGVDPFGKGAISEVAVVVYRGCFWQRRVNTSNSWSRFEVSTLTPSRHDCQACVAVCGHCADQWPVLILLIHVSTNSAKRRADDLQCSVAGVYWYRQRHM
jgi:hypothetical protein